MLLDLLTGTFDKWTLVSVLLSLPCVMIALCVHECAHGYAAYKLGDPTARNLGRLTLNPLKHLDLIGTLCMLTVGFGWAKPVPINTRYFKKYRRDMALTAAAGPLSNFILGALGSVLSALFTRFILPLIPYSQANQNLVTAIFTFLQLFAVLNFMLCFFNLIPLPPFDGSRILFVFLPDKYYFGIMKYERYIMIGFLVLLWTDIIPLPIDTIAYFFNGLIYNLIV